MKQFLLKIDFGRFGVHYEKSVSAEKGWGNARTGKGGSSNATLENLSTGTKHRAFTRLGYD